MLQYKIPQDVQVEDKIVAFLTMKHLVILMVGGGISYMFFMILSSTYFFEVWLPPTAFTAILTLLIAFVKPMGLPFIKWIFLLTEFIFNPRKMVWDKTVTTSLLFQHISRPIPANDKQPEKEQKTDNKKEKSFSRLDELTEDIDRDPFQNFQQKGPEQVKDINILNKTLDSTKDIEKRLEQSIQNYEKKEKENVLEKQKKALDSIEAYENSVGNSTENPSQGTTLLEMANNLAVEHYGDNIGNNMGKTFDNMTTQDIMPPAQAQDIMPPTQDPLDRKAFNTTRENKPIDTQSKPEIPDEHLNFLDKLRRKKDEN